MDHLPHLLLYMQKVFSQRWLQCPSEKWDIGKPRALKVGKRSGDSIISLSPVMIMPENKGNMTTTKTEKNTKLSVTDNNVNACGTVSSHDRLPEMKSHTGLIDGKI